MDMHLGWIFTEANGDQSRQDRLFKGAANCSGKICLCLMLQRYLPVDRVTKRDDFVAMARRAAIPILVIYGGETPPKSLSEMEALTALPNVTACRIDRGKLCLHEEFPDLVVAPIEAFLS